MDYLTFSRSQRSLRHWLWFTAGLLLVIAVFFAGVWTAKWLVIPRFENDAQASLTPSVDTGLPGTQDSGENPPPTGSASIAQDAEDAPAADTDGTPATNSPANDNPPVRVMVPAVGSPTITASSNITDAAATLAQAQLRLREGDFEAARAQFNALLEADIAPTIRLETLFYLARADLGEDSYAAALTTLDRLEDAYNASTNNTTDGTSLLERIRSQSLFLRGQALAALSRPDEAVTAYLAFLDVYPEMTMAVEPRLARAYLAQSDFNNAAGAYRRAADATIEVMARVQLLESLAQVYRNAGNQSAAVATYDEILGQAQNAGYRAQMQFEAAQSLAAAGNIDGAIERWRATTDEAPATRIAHQALVELVNRDVPFDLYRRGMINLAVQSYLPAINAYTAFLESAEADDTRIAPARHELGQAHIGAGNYAAAVEALTFVLEDHPDCTCFGQANLDLARTRALQGDSLAAKRAYRTFARDHGNDALAPEALWRSAMLSLNEGNTIEAAVDFLALADAFPTSDRAPQALYAVGVGAFQAEIYDQSAFAYARLQNGYPDYRWDAVGYWLGRAYRADGKPEDARQQFQQLVDRAPDVYYGILAAYALNQTPMTGGAMLLHVAQIAGPPTRLSGDDGSQAFAERWLAEWLQADANMLSSLPPAVAQDPDLAVGRMLLTLGERGEGLAVLERVYQRYRDDPWSLYAMILEFERINAYRLSLLSAARLLQFSPAQLVEDAPVFLQQKVYPQRFANLIIREAQAHNLDPLLYFSLIRQESLFEEGARSVAAAQGLAQIIPDTGQWIADRIGYPNYTNALVYRPVINVRFGAYYLDWARGYLDGNLVSALVGYNGGPGNSQRWRTLSGPDDTIFMERVEFTESRIYVHTILSGLYHYTRLYGSE